MGSQTLGKLGWLFTIAALAVRGQTPPPVLENTGKPMTVPFQCTDDDMQWAGMSCTPEEPCPVYFELAAAEPVGDKIFAAGNLHSSTVTLYSILLGSEDAGKTWREVYMRVRGAGLDRIQFIDFANGWTGGGSLFPLPQDPFLLLTSDGGKTWRQRLIFSEPQPGSIQQFYFSSKEQGSLIMDRGEGSAEERYALYETPDGGENWLVKQLSTRALRLPREPAPPADWRVQADREAFRIQHRQGANWSAVASFAVSAGVCKPEPLETKPPVEPTPAIPPPAPTRRPAH